MLKKLLLRTAAVAALALAGTVAGYAQTQLDMDDIKRQSTDPSSRYYYPKLLKMFMSNDTLMNKDDYRYFYYGTMFQEDYNPYRAYPFAEELRQTEPLYLKQEHLTRDERTKITDLARKSLANNPLELSQLMYLVYVYEKNNKTNLAKIWKSKLDNLLMTIARSGKGDTPETARVVVFPRHEFDFFNLSGGSVESQDFVEPYYEKVTVRNKKGDRTDEHYFNLQHMLDQYYLKHPEEM